jgi:hypothetical protein
MIWTITLWLGMLGQAGTNPACGSRWLGLTPEECAELTHPSAERVFEIRTKRVRVSDCDGAYVGEDGCFRITRELYMDGKRLGIILGLQ